MNNFPMRSNDLTLNQITALQTLTNYFIEMNNLQQIEWTAACAVGTPNDAAMRSIEVAAQNNLEMSKQNVWSAILNGMRAPHPNDQMDRGTKRKLGENN